MKKKLFADRIVTAIDVGTTKISVLVAQYAGNVLLDIIGIGQVPSKGLAKGVVVDISQTVQSIKSAVKEAEIMAECTIESAVIGIAGAHIQSFNSHGIAPIPKGVIRQEEIDHVLASAKACALPEGQEILHVLPQYFIIDDHEKVLNPRGMHGVRLEAQVHIVTGAVASVQNLISCCESAGIHVTDVVLEQLASAQAVLSHDERELGVGIIDIGGGTSDFALYHKGSIRHTMVLPIAGNHFTNDLAIGLRTTLADAERIKKEYGIVIDDFDHQNLLEILAVQGKQKQYVEQHELFSILQPRAHELFQLIYENVKKHEMLPFMRTGLVLTGGGSLLHGVDQVAHSIFNVPVRCAFPNVEGTFSASLQSPIHATGYGLLLYALKKMDTTSVDTLTGSAWGRITARMKSWVADFF
jgi:cell division protein FtsA